MGFATCCNRPYLLDHHLHISFRCLHRIMSAESRTHHFERGFPHPLDVLDEGVVAGRPTLTLGDSVHHAAAMVQGLLPAVRMRGWEHRWHLAIAKAFSSSHTDAYLYRIRVISLSIAAIGDEERRKREEKARN